MYVIYTYIHIYIQYILYIRTIIEAGQIKPVHKYVSSKNKKSFSPLQEGCFKVALFAAASVSPVSV